MAAALDVLTGAAIEPALPDIARLRIAVFRDFPIFTTAVSIMSGNICPPLPPRPGR